MATQPSDEDNIEMWKIKRVRFGVPMVRSGHVSTAWQCAQAMGGVQLIKGLHEARGNGTSMISLIMPPKDQVRTAGLL